MTDETIPNLDAELDMLKRAKDYLADIKAQVDEVNDQFKRENAELFQELAEA